MSILISGSVAFDILLEFGGHFADHILPGQIDKLSVSFLTPHMRSDFGGCAGNIAYAVRQLGGTPLPLATIGQDGGHYLERMRLQGIGTDYIAIAHDCYTAQCTIVTDNRQNQITAFHPGAMARAHLNPVPAHVPIDVAIVSPNGKEAMQQHAAQLHAAGIPFVFDPGQGMPMFSGTELQQLVDQASWVTLNEYEAHMLCEKAGCDRAALSRQLRGLIVTLAEAGCELWVDGRCTLVPGITADAVVDPTGCGDAWRGALLFGLEQGWPLERCARLGNLMGAIKVAHRGPQNYQLDAAALIARTLQQG